MQSKDIYETYVAWLKTFQAMTDEQQIAWDRKMGAHHIDAYVSAAGIPLFNLSGRYSLEELERIVRIAKECAANV